MGKYYHLFVPSILDLPIIIITIIAAHYIINTVVQRHRCAEHKALLTRLYYYHLLFSLIYLAYIFNFGGDAMGYWMPPVRFISFQPSVWQLHQPGSAFVHFVVYPLSQQLEVSLIAGTILFSLFGFGGMICIYLMLRNSLHINPTLFGYKLFPLVLFLPNMHFWSAGVGKDSIIFFAIALFVYSLTNIKKNLLSISIAFYLAYFIRPHIALVLLVAAGLGILLSAGGVSSFWKFSALIVAVIVFFTIAPKVYEFVGIQEDSIESYEDVANIRSKNLSRSNVGSKIDISGASMPLRIFTFLYRPLFVDSVNLFGLIVSFENLFYLVLTLSTMRLKRLRFIFSLPAAYKAATLIVFATAFFMSGSLSNLGIIIRQKNMVMFLLVIVCMYLINIEQYKSYYARKSRVRIAQPD